MIIGSHVRMSSPDYLLGSVREAISYGADAMMVYTGAPQNTKRVPVSKLKIAEARKMMEAYGIRPEHVIIHAPYLINLANTTKPEMADFASEFLQSEIQRTSEIGAKYIVVHPGSYTQGTLESGIASIAGHLNNISAQLDQVTICLETMAGKGTEVGKSFEELAAILEKLNHPEHFGICFDTCHTHDSGYDLRDFDQLLDIFDHIIGLSRLHVIHLNDSKNERGARKDRHANIGEGYIGFDTLYAIAHNPRIAAIPKILETPYINDQPPYKEEIMKLQ